MKRTALISIIGIALLLAGILAVRWNSQSNGTAGEIDRADGTSGRPGLTSRRSVAALGTLQPRDGIIQISSPLVGFQITRVLVQDGQAVKAGDTLIELDAATAQAESDLALSQEEEAAERQATEIDLAKQRVAAAELAAAQAAEGRELELAAQKSRIAVANTKRKQAEKDLKRAEELHALPEPLAAEQQVEQQRLLLEAAAADVDAANSAFKRVEQTLTFQDQKAAAELKAARQSLALAEKGTGLASLKRRTELTKLKLQQTKIVAPTSGIVLSMQAHPGEVVAQQPLLQLANLDNLVCEAEVDTADVPYLQTTQKAIISCRAFQGKTLEGTVDRVGNQVVQTSLRPFDPRQPVDRDVTKVVVLLDSNQAARLISLPGKDRRAALVGLQVNVVFPLTN